MNDLWTKAYFDTVYLQRWALGPPDEAVFRQVDFLIGQLNASQGKSLIDVACGQGRYGLAFAARGLHVTGLDASEVLLREARKLASEAGISVNWMLGDMRRLPATQAYNYGLLLDSFGFFESDEENEKVIRQLRRAVVPGGRLVITIVNGTKVLRNFGPVGREEREGRVVEIRRELQADRRILREESKGGSDMRASVASDFIPSLRLRTSGPEMDSAPDNSMGICWVTLSARTPHGKSS